MARDPQTIQAEIERARDGLATAVDELTTRLDPKRAVSEGKRRLRALWDEPKIKYSVIGVGALVAYVMVRKIFR